MTALHERPRGKVEVQLDGAPWRLVPADAVVRAGLAVGRTLDRETARLLGRELRRGEALGTAARALRHRELSRRALGERLARRGIAPAAAEAAVEALEGIGLVDDRRVAAARAHALAERGYGDAAIRCALEREGLDAAAAGEALAGLEPEAERARRLLAGSTDEARALRRLASRGFDAATLEDLGAYGDETGFADGG